MDISISVQQFDQMGVISLFHFQYFIKKFVHTTPFMTILNGNSSTLCMHAYYHIGMAVCDLKQIEDVDLLKKLFHAYLMMYILNDH